MKNLFILFIFSVFVSCTAQKKFIINNNLEEVVERFINDNPKVPNGCKAVPNYGITFLYHHGDTLVQLDAFLGEPRIPKPLHPDSSININYEQRKGYGFIDNSIIVIFDYIKSEGYGLYDPSKLIKNFENKFDSLPDSCIHVLYPGPEIFKVQKGQLNFMEKLDSIHLK